ncbi:ATP-binding protein [Streptomyces sp. NPDC004546]|uniref:ATP-binding protein n=1 Tax=Streptomyces sp. NPDC004546 TaxID=3154282 RepID=UPI0033B97565
MHPAARPGPCLRPSRTASWAFPAELSAACDARPLVTAQLALWGLESQAAATELIVSELVTNAIRYAGGPILLRLIRDHVLTCEVHDAGNCSPRLRHPRLTDGNGRGLVLVDQLSRRWGTRYLGRQTHLGRTAHDAQPLRLSLGSRGSRRRWTELS